MREILGKENRSYLMGGSILWIIGLHIYMYSAFPENSVWGFLFAKGYLGVDIFLFLSAYGLCHSYQSNSLSRFYLRRLKRIFPVYLIFLCITIALFGSTYQEPNWQLFLYQSTGLATFRQTDFEWYVPALIIVYLSFPLIHKGVGLLYRRCKMCIPILIILLSLLTPYTSKILFPMFASRLTIIVLGVTTFFSLQNNDESFLYKTYALSAFFAVFFTRVNGVDWSLLIPSLLCILAHSNIKLPFQKVVCFFGKHTLEIYLAQSIALNQFFLKSDMPYINKCMVAALIIIVGSFLFYWIQATSNSIFSKR